MLRVLLRCALSFMALVFVSSAVMSSSVSAEPKIDLAGDWVDLIPLYSGAPFVKDRDVNRGPDFQMSRVAAGPEGTSYVYCNRMHGNVGHRKSVATLIKYDAEGTRLWQKTIDAEDESYASDIKVDAAGNIYVTGWVTFLKDRSISGRGFAICLSPTGKPRWEFFAHKPMARVLSRYLALALHGTSVYLVGDYGGHPNNERDRASSLLVTRLSMTGKRQWTSEFDSQERETRTSGMGITVTPSGMICVLGNFDYNALPRGNRGDETYGYAMALDPKGKKLWQTKLGYDIMPAGLPLERAHSLALDVTCDEQGNFYALGSINVKGGNSRVPREMLGNLGSFVTRLTPRGRIAWTSLMPQTNEGSRYIARFQSLRIGYGPDKLLYLFGRGKEEPGLLRCDTQGQMLATTYYAKVSRCKAADFDFLPDGSAVIHGTLDLTKGRLFGQAPADPDPEGVLTAQPYFFISNVGLAP